MAYEKLLEPIKVGPRTLQNRFFIQAMETNNENGMQNALNFYLQKVKLKLMKFYFVHVSKEI